MVFLSGAFVRGSNQMIDIFIVGDVNKTKLSHLIGELESDMARELNYTCMRIEDFDYRRNLNDRFLSDILDAKKIILLDQLEVFKKSDEEADSDDMGAAHTINVSAPSAEITAEQAASFAAQIRRD